MIPRPHGSPYHWTSTSKFRHRLLSAMRHLGVRIFVAFSRGGGQNLRLKPLPQTCVWLVLFCLCFVLFFVFERDFLGFHPTLQQNLPDIFIKNGCDK